MAKNPLVAIDSAPRVPPYQSHGQEHIVAFVLIDIVQHAFIKIGMFSIPIRLFGGAMLAAACNRNVQLVTGDRTIALVILAVICLGARQMRKR